MNSFVNSGTDVNPLNSECGDVDKSVGQDLTHEQ